MLADGHTGLRKSTMAEQKESSVLFSLKELMSLEEDRIKQEEDSKRRAEEDAARARADADRRAREEEEARLHAADEKRRVEEQRGREEQAKLDAIRHAEVERARLEAENAARMEQMKHQQSHERQLAELSQDKHKKRLTWMIVAAGVVLIIGVVGGGVFINGQINKQKALEAQLNSLNSDKEELDRKLRSATTPEEREKLEQEIAAKQAAIEGLKTNQPAPTVKPTATFHGNTGGPAPKPTGPKCNCTPGDPLCSCL
jgi:colicin import membrane protein